MERQMQLGDTSTTAEQRVEQRFRERYADLVGRIKRGHIVLWERWDYIRKMPEGARKDEFLAGWDRAKDKQLYGLYDELVAAGFCGCVYTAKEKPKYACFVCTLKPFNPAKCPAIDIKILVEE